MHRWPRLGILLVLALPVLVAQPAAAQPIRAVRVGTATFNYPILVTAPPGDTSRIFVVSQAGSVFIMNAATGVLNPTPFPTIPNVSSGGENGLLGLAFHPDYANNGFFYVYYNINSTAYPEGRMIARFHVSSNPDIADPASATTIFFFSAPASIHNGGWTAFGPDGKLYVAWGNHGIQNNSSDLTTPLGKLLRFDINGPDGIPGTADDDQFPADPNRNYCVPSDNPFAGSATNEQTIWAYGLRNPWRDSFDRATGDLYIADVGDAAWEEVDYAPPPPAAAGRNYGYPCMEGFVCDIIGGTSCPCNNPSLTPPIYAYSHANSQCAIIGGYVYRGCAMPWLNGQYFFGDRCTGHLWSGHCNGTALVDIVDRTNELWNSPNIHPQITSWGEDARGELYLCDDTAIYKLLPATLPDCNNNGIADGCDIANGTSQDVNHNGTPDECENPPPCRPCDADFDQDGDPGTDADIEAFFASLAGHGPSAPTSTATATAAPTQTSSPSSASSPAARVSGLRSSHVPDKELACSDRNADIEASFRVLAGGEVAVHSSLQPESRFRAFSIFSCPVPGVAVASTRVKAIRGMDAHHGFGARHARGASVMMHKRVRSARKAGLSLVSSLLLSAAASTASAQWTVVSLHPTGAVFSWAYGAGNGQQVGYSQVGGVFRASLWTGTAASWVDMHPAAANYSEADGVDDGQQAGNARVDGHPHAALWGGTATSWIDLNPASVSDSYCLGVGGGLQVGYAVLDSGYHAAAWSGTAASWVDLHPAAATGSSEACGTEGGRQAGWAAIGGYSHAMLWSGSAASAIDLSPPGALAEAYAIGGGRTSSMSPAWALCRRSLKSSATLPGWALRRWPT